MFKTKNSKMLSFDEWNERKMAKGNFMTSILLVLILIIAIIFVVNDYKNDLVDYEAASLEELLKEDNKIEVDVIYTKDGVMYNGYNYKVFDNYNIEDYYDIKDKEPVGEINGKAYYDANDDKLYAPFTKSKYQPDIIGRFILMALALVIPFSFTMMFLSLRVEVFFAEERYEKYRNSFSIKL